MKSNREGFDFDKNGEINESKEALGLNKHIQKKFSSKREDAVEEVGKVVWYNASDFADAIRDRLKNDEIAKHFDLIVAEEPPKSPNGNHKIKIFTSISTDFYMPVGSVVFDYKKEKPMFYVVYSLGNITSFKGKKAIETVKNKYSWMDYSKYEANSEEVDLLVKDIDRVLREKFPENDLFIGEKSKAIDESASLGLNKHVQKKFEGTDKVENLETELSLDVFKDLCVSTFSKVSGIKSVWFDNDRYQNFVFIQAKDNLKIENRCTSKNGSNLGVGTIYILIDDDEFRALFQRKYVEGKKIISKNIYFGLGERPWSAKPIDEPACWFKMTEKNIESAASWLDQWMNKIFSEEDLNESMKGLGLNKHVQKKFQDIDAIDNISDYVDLGLPSGTLWCSHNYGTEKEYEYGDLYSFEEAQSLGISLPTKEDFTELHKNCTHELTTVDDVHGMMFTSKSNGESVFFPAAGYKFFKSVSCRGSEGRYWSSEDRDCSPDGYGMVFDFYTQVNPSGTYLKTNAYSLREVQKPMRESSLGLNKHIQKKFNDNNPEGMAEEIGNLIYMSADDFFDGLQRQIDKDPVCRAFNLKVRDIERKSYYQVNAILNNDEYEEIASIKVLEKSKIADNPLFLLTFYGKYPVRFEGKNPILSKLGTNTWWNTNAEETGALVEFLKEKMKKNFPSKVNEASLGLNKRVQKKFEEKDAIDNLELDYVDLGLPSGTRWCKHNYGAISEEETGERLEFGEAQKLDVVVPSQKDFIELYNNCDHKAEYVNGIYGIRFISKKNEMSIFLPERYSNDKTVRGERYWSSTEFSSESGYNLSIDYDLMDPTNYNSKFFKYPVRPVQRVIKESSLGLNKKVQKKFDENTEKNIENLNIIDEDLFVSLCIEEFSKSPYLETVEDGGKNRYRWIIMKPEEKYRVDVVRGKSGVSSQIFIKIFNGDDPKNAYFEIKTFMYVFKDDDYDTPGQNPYVSSSQNPGYYDFKFKGAISVAEIKKASTGLNEFFKRFSEFLSESSLGLNKRVQKKFKENNSVETVANELGALDVQSFEEFVIKYLDGAIIDGKFTVKYRATFEDEQAFNATTGIGDYVNIDRICFDVYDSDGKELSDSLNVYVDKENDKFDLECNSLPEWEFHFHLFLDRLANTSLSIQSLRDRIGKHIESHVNESSLGLNKHVQKKFEDKKTEDKAVEIGSQPLSKEDFKERVIEEINKEFDKIGYEHYSLKAWFRPSTWREDEYVDIRYKDDNNYHAVARICIKNDSLKKEQSFFAVWQDDNWKTVHMSRKDDPVDFINGTDISSHDFVTPQFRLTHNSVNAFIDWLVNKSEFPMFSQEVNEGKKSLGLNKHVQKKFEDKKSEDMTEEIDVMSIDEFEAKFIEEINSLEISQAPLVKFHAVKRELDKIIIETTYPGKLSSALLDSTPTSNGQLELYVDEDDGSIVFSFWCCNSLMISNGYKSEWFGRKKNKGDFYHKMCYKNLFKAISFARDFFTRHHDELYSDIDESSLGLNKRVQKRYEEQDPVDTEGLDIIGDASAFMFAVQRYVQKKYSDVFTKFNLNDNIAKFKGELVDAKILNMYDNRFDPYNRFNPRVIITIDKKNLKFSVYVAMKNRGILYDDGSEWHDLSLSIMRSAMSWAVKVFTGEIHESSLGLNKKVQKQYASKDIDNAIDMVSVSHLAVPVLFSDGHVDIKYLSCISTKEDIDDVIIKEKKSIIKRLVKHEGFTLLDGGKSVDDYVLTLTDERIRGQRHMYRFRFVMTPSMHDRGLCGTDQNDTEGGIAILPVDYIVKTHDDLEFSKLLLDKFGVSNPQFVYQGNATIYQDKDDGDKDIIIAQLEELKPRSSGKVYHSYYCTLRL